MLTSPLEHAVIPRHRIHPRTRPAFAAVPDDTGELDIEPPQPAYEQRDPLPRATWTHGLLAGITGALAAWVIVDLIDATNPHAIDGLMRAALVGSAVMLASSISNWRLYRRNERLHHGTRAAVEWVEERARAIETRDRSIHQHLAAISDMVRGVRREAAEDLATTRHAIDQQRQDLMELARGLGNASGHIRTLSHEVASIGGGQAVVMEAIQHLAHLADEWYAGQRNIGGDSDDGHPGSDVRRAYSLGEQEVQASKVVPMPHSRAVELGRQIERRRWEQGRDDHG